MQCLFLHATADSLCVAVKAFSPNQFLSIPLSSSLNQTMHSCDEKPMSRACLLSGAELKTSRQHLSSRLDRSNSARII